MPNIDYNAKYKFISDGTWFVKGSECIVEDGNSLWRNTDGKNSEEISSEEMKNKNKDIMGIFVGPRIDKEGEEPREDGEVCGLCEFTIVEK